MVNITLSLRVAMPAPLPFVGIIAAQELVRALVLAVALFTRCDDSKRDLILAYFRRSSRGHGSKRGVRKGR
jgi:hypothetical protein